MDVAGQKRVSEAKRRRIIACLSRRCLGVAKTGSSWCELPDELGLWNSVYKRFVRWSDAKVWQRVFDELGKDADFESGDPNEMQPKSNQGV